MASVGSDGPERPPNKRRRVGAYESERLLGRTLEGKYRIDNIIGVGGNGIVYEAFDLSLRRAVAVKIPRRHRVSTPSAMRFHREARAGAAIAHPNVCALYDFGLLQEGTPFLVMERLIGETVQIRLARDRRMPLSLALPIMIQVLGGLSAAHAQGIVHRDMKPGNIFLVDRKRAGPMAKVLDFGSSTIDSRGSDSEEEATELHTAIGTAVGTPQYMSPEQVSGHRNFDPRVDVFACGVILYEIVTGRRPFRAPNTKALFEQIVAANFAPPSVVEVGLPHAFDDVLAKAITSDRKQRYSTASEFSGALNQLLDSMVTSPPSCPPQEAVPPKAAARLAYLQSRFRELAFLHSREKLGLLAGAAKPTSATPEIPVVFDETWESPPLGGGRRS